MVSGNCLGLDYAKNEVRTLMLDYIRELATNYSFELLELDWLRFHNHFYPGEGKANRHLVTEFMTAVRGVLENSGRQVVLMARVPQSPGRRPGLRAGCRRLGEKRPGRHRRALLVLLPSP